MSLIGVDYLRLKTGDGGDLYLPRFGLPFQEQLAPQNWYAPDWFAARRMRLPGTSAIYKVPASPARGVRLNLVVRFSRVGQETGEEFSMPIGHAACWFSDLLSPGKCRPAH